MVLCSATTYSDHEYQYGQLVGMLCQCRGGERGTVAREALSLVSKLSGEIQDIQRGRRNEMQGEGAWDRFWEILLDSGIFFIYLMGLRWSILLHFAFNADRCGQTKREVDALLSGISRRPPGASA